jgi:hypothetical protein
MRYALALVTVAASILFFALNTNSGGTAQARFSGEALPDLIISDIRIEWSGGNTCYSMGSVQGTRVSVRNVGDADAGPFVLDRNGSQKLVEGGLQAGGSASFWFNDVPPQIHAVVDYTSIVIESNEDNNTFDTIIPTSMPPPPCTPTPTPTAENLPDLIISGVQIEWSGGNCWFIGSVMGTRVWVQNIGAGDAGPFDVDLGGSQQSVEGGLPTGGGISLWFSYVPPLIHAVVDSMNTVVESNEDNNILDAFLPTSTPPPPCTPTPAPTPTATPGPVGGVAEYASPGITPGDGSDPGLRAVALACGAAGGALLLAGCGWHARRRYSVRRR